MVKLHVHVCSPYSPEKCVKHKNNVDVCFVGLCKTVKLSDVFHRQIPELHWRLSSLENFSRMRPKLVPNHTFDAHLQASQLRDNVSTDATAAGDDGEPELPALPLAGDIGDDRLGDDEWNMIEQQA